MPVIQPERKGIMVDFGELTNEQQIEQLQELARTALSAYGLGQANLTNRSYTENAVFEVQDEASGSHASLRVCRPTWEPEALRRETAWLESLGRETELRVPTPIRTTDGDVLCIVESDGVPEPRACVLFAWVEGEFARPEELTPARMEAVGRFLGSLHNHAQQEPDTTFSVKRFDANALAASDHRESIRTYFKAESDLRAFDEAIEATLKAMRELGDGPTHAGIIHGDFHQRNYVFDGDSIGALDFETLLWGYYVYDLATTLSYLVPRFLRDVDPEPLRAAVLDGYAQVRELPHAIESLLRVFSAYRVWIMADWLTGSPKMLEQEWVRGQLDSMPEQVRALLGTGESD